MAYATVDDVKKVLGTDSTTYDSDLADQIEYADGIIDGALAGVYDLRFDDTALYTSVPVQIKMIASRLIAYQIYDKATVLEGLSRPTSGAMWKDQAMEMLEKLRLGEMRLTLEDGTLVGAPDSSLPRSYPEGTRDKAPSEQNVPYFTRDQAGKW